MATWSSSDTAVVQVSNEPGQEGRAVGFVLGSATVTATLGGHSDTSALTVIPAAFTSNRHRAGEPDGRRGAEPDLHRDRPPQRRQHRRPHPRGHLVVVEPRGRRLQRELRRHLRAGHHHHHHRQLPRPRRQHHAHRRAAGGDVALGLPRELGPANRHHPGTRSHRHLQRRLDRQRDQHGDLVVLGHGGGSGLGRFRDTRVMRSGSRSETRR